MNDKISIVGVGRLGLCLALNLEKNGCDLICVDSNETYINHLKSKTFISDEPGVNELLIQSKNIEFTTDLKKAITNNIIFVVVQTPSTKDNRYDHTIIEQICNQLISYGKQIERKDIIINCTTFPGYCEKLHNKLKNYNYFISYNPEFIAQGTIINDQINADMILIGEADTFAGDLIEKIHKRFCFSKKIHRMSRTEAELTKLSLNCFITTKITFANMIGDICISLGHKPDAVLNAIGEDSRVGQKYLKYGYGFGGPCFPRDNRALAKYAEDVNIDATIPKATDIYNNNHLQFQVNQYIEKNPDKNQPVIMDYLTYKKESSLLVESQQLEFAKQLKKSGYNIIVKDPRPEVLSQSLEQLN